MSVLTGEWWRPFLAGFVVQGYSGAKALATLRESGPVARTKTFYDAWRQEVGYEKGTWLASQQPLDKKLPESSYILSESHISHPYTYKFTVREYDPDTGT